MKTLFFSLFVLIFFASTNLFANEKENEPKKKPEIVLRNEGITPEGGLFQSFCINGYKYLLYTSAWGNGRQQIIQMFEAGGSGSRPVRCITYF